MRVSPTPRAHYTDKSIGGEQLGSGRFQAEAFAAVTALMFTPWMSTVEVPAVLTSEKEEAIYLPFAARLAGIDVVRQ